MSQNSHEAITETTLPLSGIRIVDLTDGPIGAATRLLAELGADVVLVEPPEGLSSRRAAPRHGDVGIGFMTAHANKRGVVADLTSADGRARILDLISRSHAVVESLPPGRMAEVGLSPAVLRERNPGLVVVSISEFGQDGPRADWRGGEAVQMALSSTLTRSGAPGREPLLPPGDLAVEAAATSAAFATLLALLRAQDTGRGDYVDCAVHDLAVQGVDPGFGMAGTATMGRPLTEMAPGRPDARMLYPIFACSDGHVRLCMLAPKHWRAMFGWLGEPAEFADPAFENLLARFKEWPRLRAAIAELFATESRSALVQRGSELGVPIAALNTPAETVASDHVAERRSFLDAEVYPGVHATIANGGVEIDGRRAGFRFHAPALGEHDPARVWEDDTDERTSAALAPERADLPPLAGLRVLDLGVIVVGAETGRLLADYGAEVIKIENRAFMDGARQADAPGRVSHPCVVGHRGKLSLGLNLRSPRGIEIFRKLVATSDVVLTNFKPGTMESLGLGYDALRNINPGIIAVDSSALGSSGPWSRRMGYGPLVRATVGLTTLWRHPDTDDGFGDDMTVYPDHAAARVAVTAVVAALISRRATGVGAAISVAQMETVFTQLSRSYLRESLQPGSMIARGNDGEFDAPHGVFRCSGEDAYCVVTVDGDDDWHNLTRALQRPDLAERADLATASGRVAHRTELNDAVQQWITDRDPRQAADHLQAHAIPAAAAVHARDLTADPQLRHRRAFTELRQPGWDQPITVETGVAVFEEIAVPAMRPAPTMAQDTRRLCATLLGMSDTEIDGLVDDGALELATEPAR